MPIQKLKTFLDEREVRYVTISHSRAYTAQEVAASAHIPGREMAKTVMVRVDGTMAMAVLPAPYQVDLGHLRDVLGAERVELATEEEFQDLFPSCELGAMPPFGTLYGMPTYVAEALAEDDEIAFNAGTHTELIRMRYDDFERLAEPTVLPFAMEAA